jgi:hypothetical protein
VERQVKGNARNNDEVEQAQRRQCHKKSADQAPHDETPFDAMLHEGGRRIVE